MTPTDDPPVPPDQGPVLADQPPGGESTARRRAAEGRRLAEIFGDVLPDSTRDDVSEPARSGEEDAEAARDAATLREVPPHHGST